MFKYKGGLNVSNDRKYQKKKVYYIKKNQMEIL